MVKPPLRTKSVGTKVSDAEYAALGTRARASGLTLSEWVRDVLLGSGRPVNVDTEVLLAEVLALRTVLINLLFSMAKSEPMTAEGMQGLIERADKDKARRALEKLGEVRVGPAPATASEPESQEVGP